MKQAVDELDEKLKAKIKEVVAKADINSITLRQVRLNAALL